MFLHARWLRSLFITFSGPHSDANLFLRFWHLLTVNLDMVMMMGTAGQETLMAEFGPGDHKRARSKWATVVMVTITGAGLLSLPT